MTNLSSCIKLAALVIVAIIAWGCSSPTKLSVSDLACENLHNPTAIATDKPRFSWKNTSTQQGAHQTAYQILVADNVSKLKEGKASFWDSGKIDSPSSVLVEYGGKPLEAGQLLYWKVRTWDENGKPSSWSKPARFGIGLLTENDWSASYIGYASERGFHSSPQLRKTFSVDKKDKNDTYMLHVNSLGYHEVYINGTKVSDDVLSPAVSQFNKRSLVVTYDVTPNINKGTNDIIIWLGSGWYSKDLPGIVGNNPLVKAQLQRIAKGTMTTLVETDESWTARDSEYTRISNWLSGRYGGETITGNIETRNKVFTNPDSLQWNNVFLAEVPQHEATPQTSEPNRIKKTIIPVEVKPFGEKTFLVDMGTTLTGWFEIAFTGLKQSQEVELEYSDHLNEEGQLERQGQTDKYVASGYGQEVFLNKFNYHGFRYVKISNLDTAPELSSMKGHLIYTDFADASSFECSDSDMNSIHDMIHYTLQCVGLGGYLVDCPQIERLGYGGDGNASTITAQTMFNLAPMYNNWLQAWADVIRDNGSMPHTAPNPYSAGGGPYWCGFIISASWNTYMHYNDARLLEKHYPVMQKWLGYVDAHSVDGLLKRWPDTDYRAWYLGDWATPDGVGDPNQSKMESVDLVSNCYISVCFGQMEKIAEVLGKHNDATYYRQRKEILNKTIHNALFNPKLGYYATGAQIELIYPILAGVATGELRDKLIETLITRTETEFKGHMNTGLVGIPVMMEWAATANKPDFIYSMLKKKTRPGYLYMLQQGATTTWEHWNGARSRIHNCYNGVGQWFYQVVGGIRAIEGETAYRKFIIDPQIPNGITWAKTTKECPYGTIAVNWQLLDKRLSMDVQIPVGTTALIACPENATNIYVDGAEVMAVNGFVTIASGKYRVEMDI